MLTETFHAHDWLIPSQALLTELTTLTSKYHSFWTHLTTKQFVFLFGFTQT